MNCTIFTPKGWNWVFLYWYTPFFFFNTDYRHHDGWDSRVCLQWGRPRFDPGEAAPGEGNGYPLQYSCLENSMDWGAWRAPQIVWVGLALRTYPDWVGSALYFIRHYSETSLCQKQRPYIITLNHQENPYSKEIGHTVLRRRKHGVRGLGTRDWKLASR